MNPNWPASTNYRMSNGSLADCDQQRHGLKWLEKTQPTSLVQIDPSSIRTGSDFLSDNKKRDQIQFGFKDDAYAFGIIKCRVPGKCEQMASDLKETC